MSQELTAATANRGWWDSDASRYHAEHASYLDGFHWSPEMIAEADVRLLGDVSSSSVLELGCGSASCSRWLADDGVGFVTGFDISRQMLAHASPTEVPLAQADVQALPYRSESFDIVFSAFGGLPFIPHLSAPLTEAARVLRPGGSLVVSTNHPMRWVFPDDPGPDGLVALISYFEDGYIERDDSGEVVYAEYHHSFGDWIRGFASAGLVVRDVIEPAWPEDLEETWGQWSPLRGRIFPGTVIFVVDKPVDG